MSGYRLARGGIVERARPLGFTWDGRAMEGLAGDTLASALMANGEHILARSFKYHRPRGIMSAGPEESGALVTVGAGARRDPNAKATPGSGHTFAHTIARDEPHWANARLTLERYREGRLIDESGHGPVPKLH